MTRKSNGQFANGNPGGPGRPKRQIERAYLRALSESVTLEDWRAICQSAVEGASSGDPHARAWLARYLLGDKPVSLTTLAAEDLLFGDDDLIAGEAEIIRAGPSPFSGASWGPAETARDKARKIAAGESE